MGCYDKMLPSPKFLCDTDDYVFHGLGISGDFAKAIEIFRSRINAVLGLELSDGENIVIRLDETIAKNEYYISATDECIAIRAGGDEGANYAFASLLQVIQRYEDKLLCAKFEMHDMPDADYRGLMIDCARNVHPLPLLKKYVDMCWFYKIRCLHIHFTDDQAYTLPSDLFPLLTSEHNHYTKEEIAELVEYAHNRAVQIVPEIDTPGHSNMIRGAYPELFGKDAIICLHEDSVKAMQALYGELCDMFPYSEYIHIGADESSLMQWNDCEKCIEYGLSVGIDIKDLGQDGSQFWRRAERFLAHYINKVSEIIVTKGRKPLVWEGFSNQVNDLVSKDVTVMVFESLYQTAPSLLKGGFKVINCSWRPTYVVTPAWFWGKNECYKWDMGSFSAVHPDSPYYNGVFRLDSSMGIQGGQLNAWGDTLASLENGLEDEFGKLWEDLPAIAENTWNKTKRADYMKFLECDKHCARIFQKIIDAAE